MFKSHSFVTSVFNPISYNYDKVNSIMTLFLDKLWRRKAVSLLMNYNPQKVLDIATGTAEMIIVSSKLNNTIEYTGIDISEKMLEIAQKKIIKKRVKNCSLILQSIEDNNFCDEFFNGAMVAFGIRNFENLEKALTQIYRILKKGSPFVILEAIRFKDNLNIFLEFYLKYIVPLIGKIFTGNKISYNYFYKSIKEFYTANEIIELIKKNNFKIVYKKSYFNIIGIFVFVK
ncbi:MAG: ubiquinone/menaquinone biosynthesis methyltransferase [Bacteroidales bacterium]|nr:ubiquinone/menaquinone biosynthesis methyltransferase [Bacteroidales bacterium]